MEGCAVRKSLRARTIAGAKICRRALSTRGTRGQVQAALERVSEADIDGRAQLLAQAAGQIRHHAQPVGHGAGTSLPFSASCECSSRPATVVFNSVSMAAAAARRASACSRSRRCSAARISRISRAAPGDGKVDLQGMARPACSQIFSAAAGSHSASVRRSPRPETRGGAMRQRGLAALGHFDVHAQLRAHHGRRSCARLRFQSPSECSCPAPSS